MTATEPDKEARRSGPLFAEKGPDPFSAVEEFLHLVEPALGARVVARVVLLGDGVELAQQLALARVQADRRLHHDVAEQVARLAAAHALDALALEAEGLARLGFGRHADLRR